MNYKEHGTQFTEIKKGGNNMAKKKGIPGVSFSLNRALGITDLKRDIAKTTGIPTTKSGMERKVGAAVIKAITGKK